MPQFEVTLGPLEGLHQSVDYPLVIRYPPEYGVQPGDQARLEIRRNFADPTSLDTLTSGGPAPRITLALDGDGYARVTVLLTGEASRSYPSGPKDYVQVLLGPEDEAYTVLSLIGTLTVSNPSGVDRQGAVLDVRLLFEASATRGP